MTIDTGAVSTLEQAGVAPAGHLDTLPVPRVAAASERPQPDRLTRLAGDAGGVSAALVGAGVTPVGVALAVGVMALLVLSRRSAPRLVPRALDEAPFLASRVAVALLAVAPFAGDASERVLLQAAITAPAVVGARALVYLPLRTARKHRRVADRVAIVGAGQVATDLAAAMTEHPEYGMEPIGFVDDAHPVGAPLPVLGGLGDLEDVLRRADPDRVVVAFTPAPSADLVPVLRTALSHGREVFVVPRFFELGVTQPGSDVEDVWGIPLQRVGPPAVRCRGWRAKRALDIGLAGPALLALSPLLLVIALMVRLTSPGPVLFRQRRVGQDGRPIEVLKFRTMLVNQEGDTRWSVACDATRTPVGRFLRRTSLDELPQLWNVVRGDMSLVGPRPERPFFAARFAENVPGYDDRHRVPAGLTGLAQVHGLRGDTSIRDRARFDNLYVENWSLWRDLVVLVRTATALFKGR